VEAVGTDARSRAIRVIGAVVRDGAPLRPTLARALGDATGAERSLVTDVAYGTLRHLHALDAALSARLSDPAALPGVARDVLRAGAYELLVRGTAAHAAVHAYVELLKATPGPAARLSGLVNAVLRRVSWADVTDEAARLSLPEPLWAHLRAALGDEAAAAARAMLSPAPVFLHPYTADAAERLVAEGCTVQPAALGTLAVRLSRPLERLQAFREGAVQAQNPSSVAVVRALGVARGERILDVGAGHGIKTAQLCAAGASVIAVDVDPARIAAGRANLARLGFSAEHVVHDATTSQAGLAPVDAALIDAPCTGTGTLRAHPEIKLRWSEAASERAAAIGAAMLARVAERVRPGGRLVYAVCALGLREGPAVVAAFLRDTPDWRAEPIATPLPMRDAAVGSWLLPTDAGHDGFYLARLERRG
jgi:16S rRNA (cytosine967-C5)-methyltransferase